VTPTPPALVLLPLLLAAGGGSGPPAGTSPDPAALLAAAGRVQDRDLDAWRRFAFRREALRQRLDARGEVTFRQRLEFRVEPAAGGFDERLVAIDGRAPTPREVAEHRRAERFSRHHRRAREGRFGGVVGVGELDFRRLFGALRPSYRGRATVDGVPCHHLAIEALAGDAGERDRDALAAATAGELWLAADGLHLVRARTRLTRPVTQGLVEIERLELGFEAAPVHGVWLPRRIEVRSSVRGLVRLRAHNIYRYREFERRIPDPAPAG